MTSVLKVFSKKQIACDFPRPSHFEWAGLDFLRRQVIQQQIVRDPHQHLISVTSEGRLSKPFLAWQSESPTLFFLPSFLKRNSAYLMVLSAFELVPPPSKTVPWKIVDSRGALVETIHGIAPWIIKDAEGDLIGLVEKKWATLPSPFLQRDDLYEQLAPSTYRIADREEGRPVRIALSGDERFAHTDNHFLEELSVWLFFKKLPSP